MQKQPNKFVKKVLICLLVFAFMIIAVFIREGYLTPEKEKDIFAQVIGEKLEQLEKANSEKKILTEEFFRDKKSLRSEYDEYITKLDSKNKGLEKTLEQYRDKSVPILDLNKVKHPTYIVNEMLRIWIGMGGTYSYVPYCIAAYESNFQTWCHATKGEDSRGLFQVNYGDPAHKKRIPNPNKLFDPRYNMNYQFKELIFWEKKGIKKGLTGAELVKYVAKYGQRPSWRKWIEDKIDSAYKEYNSILISN